MDQRVVAGVGNIYANEALWRAGIDPSRAAGSRQRTARPTRLRDGIVGVLTRVDRARGTSFRDYRDASGERGGFVERLAVYGRAGEPCPRCGATADRNARDRRTDDGAMRALSKVALLRPPTSDAQLARDAHARSRRTRSTGPPSIA